MTVRETFDAVVVGAGPAGSSTAYRLAKGGRRVLLIDKATFPRDKPCGDGLTRRSVQALRAMGLADLVEGHVRIRGVRVLAGEASPRASRYDGRGERGAVVTRWVLDDRLRATAGEAGAVLWQGTTVRGLVIEEGRVVGVRVRRAAGEVEVRATFVVGADGSRSLIGKQAGLLTRDAWSTGFAARGYFENIEGLDDLFEFWVPIREPGRARTVAGYGWVFPLGGDRANIGVGFFPAQRGDLRISVRRMYDEFVAELSKRDRRFSKMTSLGPWRGGALDAGFSEARCAGRGVLLVGDAAGLVDPFTGEGIDSALKSGELAAEVLGRALTAREPSRADLGDYARSLTEQFAARFQTGRKFVRNHAFLWKLFAGTGDTHRPLFDGLRRAIVDYGVSEEGSLSAAAARSLPAQADRDLVDEVEAFERRLSELISSEFPLLSKVSRNLPEDVGRLVRPLLVLLAARLGSSTPAARVDAAAAAELGHLAFLAHESVVEAEGAPGPRPLPEGRKRQVNWCNLFAVMGGDSFMVRSYTLVAALGADLSEILTEGSAVVSGLKLEALAVRAHRALTPEEYVSLVAGQTAQFYANSCRLGGRLGGLDEATRNALSSCGHHLGLAARLASDAREIDVDVDAAIDHPLVKRASQGDESYPLLLALPCRESSPGPVRVDADDPRAVLALVRAGEARRRTWELARTHARRAEQCLENLSPPPPMIATFNALAAVVVGSGLE